MALVVSYEPLNLIKIGPINILSVYYVKDKFGILIQKGDLYFKALLEPEKSFKISSNPLVEISIKQTERKNRKSVAINAPYPFRVTQIKYRNLSNEHTLSD